MAKLKNKEQDILNSIDTDYEIFNEIKSKINKQIPNTAFNLNTDDVSTVIKDFVSTGSIILDTKISNNAEKAGMPVSRIIEIYGPHSSGKTLIGIHALIDCQKRNGIAIYIDTEYRVSKLWMESLGVDTDKLIYCTIKKTEDIFQIIETIISEVYETQIHKKPENRKIVTVVLDSIANATTEEEEEKGYGERTMASKAKIVGQGLRKITSILSAANVCFIIINQLRSNMNTMAFGSKTTTTSGNSIAYSSTVRLDVRRIKSIKVGDMEIGQQVQIQITKNSVSGGGRSVVLDLYQNRGISEANAILDIMLEIGKIQKINAQKSALVLETGELIEFKNREFEFGMYREHKKYIDDLVRKSLIIDLSNPNLEETRETVEEEF